MADRKISELTNITGANLADDDEFALVDTSADETKAITFGEFKTALDTATGFVRITGDTMTGNLTVPNVVVSGNVDGRDVSADGTKLDGIEAGADVTDTTNVTAAGALMDSELSNLAAVKAINQGLSTSDSPSFDAVTVGSTSDPSSEMTILSSIGGTSELRLGDTDADAGSIKYFNSNDQLVLRAAAATRVIFSSTGASITGKTTTDELDLNAIAATISDTAVDIFVYDTRKDSDGGAWRKRTQHTSWYNEAASSTRGSRKEFPAVAVIVAESDQVTIYDGDDPDLPMWMVFNVGSNHMFGGNATIAVVNASCGIITSSNGSSGGGLYTADFLKDYGYNYQTNGLYTKLLNVSERNTTGTHTLVDSSISIVNNVVNDVAMTVLPNAPIDAATGLPVPTIAVATDGGVSVIKDDGNVYDLAPTNYPAAHIIDFHDAYIYVSTDIGSYDANTIYKFSIPSSDQTNSFYSQMPSYIAEFNNLRAGTHVGNQGNGLVNGSAYGSSLYGLGLLFEDTTTPANSSMAYITSDYNTGWMNGDIKLATLSDTDATNVTGSELVTNGDFSSATGWSVPTGVSISGGVATFSSPSHGSNLQQTATSFVSGKTYTISVEVTAFTSGGITIYANYSSGTSTTVAVSKLRSVGLHSFTWTAAGDGTGFSLQADAASNGACILTLDNVSVRLAEADRSVNGNGLQVFGTVTKSAVATGADLVAYSGFSLNNYLRQPVNADMQGANNKTFMGWFKTSSTSGYQYLLSLGSESGSSYGLAIHQTTGVLYAYDSVNGTDNTASVVTDGTWHHVVLVDNGSTKKIYLDGVLIDTFSISTYTVDTDEAYYIGLWGGTSGRNHPFLGSLALQRFSHTLAPPEQIAKIYEDEKVLFQENAQATLYGSSDAVTALAYDDSTNLLHVGTSAGRSVFQGLRRVDNTTTAVGAAISASNGLVADE